MGKARHMRARPATNQVGERLLQSDAGSPRRVRLRAHSGAQVNLPGRHAARRPRQDQERHTLAPQRRAHDRLLRAQGRRRAVLESDAGVSQQAVRARRLRLRGHRAHQDRTQQQRAARDPVPAGHAHSLSDH